MARRKAKPVEAEVEDEDLEEEAEEETQKPKRRAKKATKTATKKDPGKSLKAQREEHKNQYPYGVAEVAEEMGITEQTARKTLRDAGVEKVGRSYGWKTQKEFKAIIKSLQKSD